MKPLHIISALSAALAVSPALAAEAPKVTVGGFATFEAGFASDDLDGAQRSQGFRNDTEIAINVEGALDSGLVYGAEVDLEADVTADADSEGTNASRTFLYLQGSWGRVELGSNTGAEGAMKVDASNIARATGGIDGNFIYYANFTSSSLIITPDLPLAFGMGAVGDESTDNNNKITYYSPRFHGLQLGASYSPDFADRGQTVSRTDADAGESGDNIALAANYKREFSGISLSVAATGEWGDSEVASREDLWAWNLGGSLSYMGFSLAGSYGSWDDSLNVSSANDSDYYTLGIAYETGPFGVSLTYLNSNYDTGAAENDFDNVALGADYKLAEGLTPYAEVSWYDQDPAGSADDNDGTVGIIGVQLAF